LLDPCKHLAAERVEFKAKKPRLNLGYGEIDVAGSRGTLVKLSLQRAWLALGLLRSKLVLRALTVPQPSAR
jgi:hypothetical protein